MKTNIDNQQERIRIKDIARLAGVSVGTVDIHAPAYQQPAGQR